MRSPKFKELFDYCDGKLYWKVSLNRRIRTGDEAGTLHHSGYILIRINGKNYRAHRVIWQMSNGPIPEGTQIDHINGIRNDNRIENLRLANPSQNAQNLRKAHKDSKSGYLGVSWYKQNEKWRARIKITGKTKFLGYFDTPEAAHEAYLAAKRELHEDCTI